jgi:hypothetical protein
MHVGMRILKASPAGGAFLVSSAASRQEFHRTISRSENPK